MRASKAIILAAGQGTRLMPYTNDRPKALVEVDGRSLLEYQLDVLRCEGIEDISLVGGYRGKQLARSGVSLYFNSRYAETNMFYSLMCAGEKLRGDVIVSYGDIVYSRGVLTKLQESDADIGVVVDNAWEAYWRERFENPFEDAESLELDSAGRIVGIGATCPRPEQVQGQYIGLMKFSALGVDALKATVSGATQAGVLNGRPLEIAYMTDLLQAMIEAGAEVMSVPIEGRWVEIDSVQDLTLDVTRERIAAIAAELT